MKVFGAMLAIFIFFAAVSVILALPTMLLWNAVIPDITKDALTPITFWQALGLALLCTILFKNSTNNGK